MPHKNEIKHEDDGLAKAIRQNLKEDRDKEGLTEEEIDKRVKAALKLNERMKKDNEDEQGNK